MESGTKGFEHAGKPSSSGICVPSAQKDEGPARFLNGANRFATILPGIGFHDLDFRLALQQLIQPVARQRFVIDNQRPYFRQ